MNIKELQAAQNGCDNAVNSILDILSKHMKTISQEMIKDIENYWEGFTYEIDACIDGQCQEAAS